MHNAPHDSIADLPPSYSYTAAGSGQDTAVMEDSGNSDIYGGFGDYYKAGEGYDNSMVTDQTDMEGCKGEEKTQSKCILLICCPTVGNLENG